jgi:hypothetical protein
VPYFWIINLKSRAPNAFNAVRDMVMVVVEVVAIAVVEFGLLQAMAKLIYWTTSQEHLLLTSVSDTMRRDLASSVTRRDTVCSNARSRQANDRSTLPTSRNDGGKAALRTSSSN